MSEREPRGSTSDEAEVQRPTERGWAIPRCAAPAARYTATRTTSLVQMKPPPAGINALDFCFARSAARQSLFLSLSW